MDREDLVNDLIIMMPEIMTLWNKLWLLNNYEPPQSAKFFRHNVQVNYWNELKDLIRCEIKCKNSSCFQRKKCISIAGETKKASLIRGQGVKNVAGRNLSEMTSRRWQGAHKLERSDPNCSMDRRTRTVPQVSCHELCCENQNLNSLQSQGFIIIKELWQPDQMSFTGQLYLISGMTSPG